MPGLLGSQSVEARMRLTPHSSDSKSVFFPVHPTLPLATLAVQSDLSLPQLLY